MILQIVDRVFSVYKVKELDSELLKKEFVFVSVTDNELSVISERSLVPTDTVVVDNGWRCFRIAEDASFDKYGMIAFLADIIAAQKTSILVVGTYDTDYILIKEERFEMIVEKLKENGCTFI